jgi:hypothetical protein
MSNPWWYNAGIKNIQKESRQMSTNKHTPGLMAHLTLTGFHAGVVLCGASKETPNTSYVHAEYAPLGNPAFREKVCVTCLQLWESDDDTDTNENEAK